MSIQNYKIESTRSPVKVSVSNSYDAALELDYNNSPTGKPYANKKEGGYRETVKLKSFSSMFDNPLEAKK